MKDVLRAAGVPCARHQLVTGADEALSFAEAVGFPLVAKPPAGAGAQATYRLDDAGALRAWLGAVPPRADAPGLLEEFLVGEEHTFDSVTTGGRRPSGRRSRTTSRPRWTCCAPRGSSGRCCCRGSSTTRATPRIGEVGPAAVRALGVRDGLTHMEWFRRPDGSVAVSEVGARPPGAQLSSMLGYVHDVDFYRMWTELVILDRFAPPERRYAAGCVYLRGQGRGRVRAVHGVEEVAAPPRAAGRRGAVAGARPAGVVGATRARAT